MIKAAIGVVVAAIVVVLLLPMAIMQPYWVETEVEIPTGWQYDDYQIAEDDVTAASGALELVELADVTYIHAKDVGEGIITYSDSSTETVTVKKAILDFYCINGQSNATYRQVIEETNPATASPYPARGTGIVVDMLTSFHSALPLYDENGDPNVGNIAPAFMSTYYEETHHKSLVYFAGISGRSILKFQPGEGMYNQTLAAMRNSWNDFMSQTQYYEPGKRVMIWIQGESDQGNMTAEQYRDYFMTFWNGVQEDSEQENSEYPFDYCMISYLTSQYTTITAADKLLIDNNSDIYFGSDVAQTFTDENGLLKGDGVHYSQAGRNVLGADLGERAVYLLGHQKINGYNPTIQTLFDLVPLFIIITLFAVAAKIIVARSDD